jgi:hypothetical protein
MRIWHHQIEQDKPEVAALHGLLLGLGNRPGGYHHDIRDSVANGQAKAFSRKRMIICN